MQTMLTNAVLRLITLLVALVIATSAYGKEHYGPYKADVLRVIDGDTVEVVIHLWPGLTKQVKLRLDGVDTPEKRGSPDCEKELAKKASEFTTKFIGDSVIVNISEVHLGKYAGRALGLISVEGKGDLSEALIDEELGREDHGGHREAWCED